MHLITSYILQIYTKTGRYLQENDVVHLCRIVIPQFFENDLTVFLHVLRIFFEVQSKFCQFPFIYMFTPIIFTIKWTSWALPRCIFLDDIHPSTSAFTRLLCGIWENMISPVNNDIVRQTRDYEPFKKIGIYVQAHLMNIYLHVYVYGVRKWMFICLYTIDVYISTALHICVFIFADKHWHDNIINIFFKLFLSPNIIKNIFIHEQFVSIHKIQMLIFTSETARKRL